MGKKDPSGRELDILRAIWQITKKQKKNSRLQCTVREIQKQLLANNIDLAQTTVQTLLKAAEAKGLVKHTVSDRKFIYTACYSDEKAAASFLDRVFGGALTDLFRALMRTRKIEPREFGEVFSSLLGSQKRTPEDRKKIESILANVWNKAKESQS